MRSWKFLVKVSMLLSLAVACHRVVADSPIHIESVCVANAHVEKDATIDFVFRVRLDEGLDVSRYRIVSYRTVSSVSAPSVSSYTFITNGVYDLLVHDSYYSQTAGRYMFYSFCVGEEIDQTSNWIDCWNGAVYVNVGDSKAPPWPEDDKDSHWSFANGLPWQYRLTDGGVEIIEQYGPITMLGFPIRPYKLVIPETLDGYTVVGVANGASVGLGASEVVCPGSVKYIGNTAFRYKDTIQGIKFGDSIERIGYSAFGSCTNLQAIIFPPNIKIIESSTCSGCTQLKYVYIPDGVCVIGENAFAWCKQLKSLELPSGIVNVPGFMCYECENLKAIEIPAGVTNIGYGAFQNCSSLTNVVIPASVVKIDAMAFAGCDKIVDLTLPANSSYCLNAFSSSIIENVKVSEGATNIADKAFDGRVSLLSVALPQSVVSIGSYAFRYCSSLKSISVPANVVEIGDSAFKNCSSLQWVSFDGAPPAGLANSDIAKDTLIWYNADYASQWKTVIAECGFTTAYPFMPTGRSENQVIEPASSVYVVVTNVIVHIVQQAQTPEIDVSQQSDVGFVTVITEVKGGAVSIPSSWEENYPTFNDLYGDDFSKALMKKTGKRDGQGCEMMVWQDYVAGTDPTDESDQFVATITLENGIPMISYSPELKPEQAALRVYRTYGKQKLSDADWVDITALSDTDRAGYNFFKVTVEMR